jgi:hypothetical protein
MRMGADVSWDDLGAKRDANLCLDGAISQREE